MAVLRRLYRRGAFPLVTFSMEYQTMSKLVVNIMTDNDAFAGKGKGAECARILREIAKKVEQHTPYGRVMDINGNTARW